TTLLADIKRLHDAEGLRHIFPIHLIDNAFGGASIYSDTFNYDNFLANHQWFDAPECTTIGGDPQPGFHLSSDWGNSHLTSFGSSVSGAPVPTYVSTSCNAKGLTPLGKLLVKQLMSEHMIIDIDHMSERSRADTQFLTQIGLGQHYPVIAGHTTFRSLRLTP